MILLSDATKTTIFLSVLFGIVGLLFLIIFLLLLHHFAKERFHDRRVKNAINSTRIYIIDLLDNRYDYFQLNKLNMEQLPQIGDDMPSITRNQKNQFYRQFKANDQIEFENWINSLLENPDDTPKIKDVNVTFSGNKKEALALFEAIHVSPSDKRVYLKSTILQNSKLALQLNFNKKSVTKDIALSAIEKSGFKGFTLIFKFYYLNEESVKTKVSDALLEGLFDVLKRYSKTGRYLINEKISAIFDLVDLKLETRNQVEMLKASIVSDFKKYLGLNGFIKDVGIAGAAVENRLYNSNSESLFDFARLLVEGVSNDPTIDFIFDSDDKTKKLSSSDIDFNTVSIIQNNVFYEFHPVVKVYPKNTREFGYFANVNLVEQNLSMRELRNNCEHDGTLSKLFSIPTTKILQAFDNESYKIPTVSGQKPRLFLNVRLADHQFFSKVLKPYIESPKQEWELVLCFTEEELTKLAASSPSTGMNLVRLSREYSLLLVLENNNEFKLPDKILSLFNYFAFNLTGISLHSSEIDNFNIISKAGKTTRYKNPIIMAGITTWSDLELLVNAGVTHFSGGVLEQKNLGIVNTVEKRILDKINALARK